MKPRMVKYHFCPCCHRATPAQADEHFCPNDGSKMLQNCPNFQRPITSPYARFCPGCGQNYSETSLESQRLEDPELRSAL